MSHPRTVQWTVPNMRVFTGLCPFPFLNVFIPSLLTSSPSYLFQILAILNFYTALQSLTSNAELSQTRIRHWDGLWWPLKKFKSSFREQSNGNECLETVTWELCSHILQGTHKCKVNAYQQLPQIHIVNILHVITVTIIRILQIL